MRHAVVTILFFIFLLEETKTTLIKGCEKRDEVKRKVRLHGVQCGEEANLQGVVPSDFPNDMNYLELVSHSFMNLSVSSFAPYPDLQYLILKYTGVHYIEENTFLSLKKLIHVDLSGNPIQALPPLPTSIEALTLNSMTMWSTFFNCSQTTKNILRLKSLKILVIKKNGLKSFPPFVKDLTSLEEINAYNNYITELTVGDLSPLCNLRELNFEGNEIAPTERSICNCRFVQKWASQHKLNIRNLICPGIPAIDDKKCEEKFPQDRASHDRTHGDCRKTTFVEKYMEYFFFGLAAVMLVAALCYHCCKRQEPWERVSSDPATVEENLESHDGNVPLKETET